MKKRQESRKLLAKTWLSLIITIQGITEIGEISLKRLVFTIAAATLILASCSSSKYTSSIDKAVDKQQAYQHKLAKSEKGDVDKMFDKNKANIYVYEKGKYVVIAYKPLRDDDEVHYYAYEIKGKKAHYQEHFNVKGYMHNHEESYKEENLDSDDAD